MGGGFRGWLYRWISGATGLLGVLVFITLGELARLYGFASLGTVAITGLSISFLVGMTSFFKVWSWKKYGLACAIVAALVALPYVALRPEMIRDDVLRQLRNPPLTVDLLVYRGLVLRGDLERETKIERLQFVYGLIGTYGAKQVSEPKREAIPEAK
jgi:hypothetical protein